MARVGERAAYSAAALLLVAASADAQFLRIGPFDFTATTEVELTYTSNVDGQRKSDAEKRREDVFVTTSLDIGTASDLSAITRVLFDASFEFEKHFFREDLDTDAEPSTLIRLEVENTHQFLTSGAWVEYEHQIDLIEDDGVYRPGGIAAKKRNPLTTSLYGGEVQYLRGPLELGVDYEHVEDRYDRLESRSGDQNEDTLNYMVGWQFVENLGVTYEVERRRTERIRDPADRPEWLQTETISLDWDVTFLERPELTYTLAIEKEDTEEKDGEWEPKHTINLSDEWEWSPRWMFSADAEYSYEENPEDDDVAFTYDFELKNIINPFAQQTLTLEREPRETFGSTQETDTTTYGYLLELKDVLLANLSVTYDVTYEINKPPDGLEEKILTQEVTVEHTREVRPRLTRAATYTYTWEDLSTEDEILDEHRVEWTYTYEF